MDHESKLDVIIIGDAFVDILCKCIGDLPVKGGDALLERAVELHPGGSGVNTATHLMSLIQNWTDGNNTRVSHRTTSCKSDNGEFSNCERSIQLYTVLGEDSYGNLLRDHAEKCGFQVINCLNSRILKSMSSKQSSMTTAHCVVMITSDESR